MLSGPTIIIGALWNNCNMDAIVDSGVYEWY